MLHSSLFSCTYMSVKVIYSVKLIFLSVIGNTISEVKFLGGMHMSRKLKMKLVRLISEKF